MTMAPHPKLCPEHGIPDCSPLLNGCSWPMTEDAGCDVAPITDWGHDIGELRRIEKAARAFLVACDEHGCSDAPLDEYASLVEAVSRLPDTSADWGHDSTETLVERVRASLELVYREHMESADDALAALTELAERLKAAERDVPVIHREQVARRAAEAQRDREKERADKLLAGYVETQEQAAELLAQRDELVEALERISEVRLPTGNAAGRDELRGCHQARLAMQDIARAALVKARG